MLKPDLRRLAIKRVLDASLAEAGHDAVVLDVIEDKKRGLVARIEVRGDGDKAAIAAVLGQFATAWDWAV